MYEAAKSLDKLGLQDFGTSVQSVLIISISYHRIYIRQCQYQSINTNLILNIVFLIAILYVVH